MVAERVDMISIGRCDKCGALLRRWTTSRLRLGVTVLCYVCTALRFGPIKDLLGPADPLSPDPEQRLCTTEVARLARRSTERIRQICRDGKLTTARQDASRHWTVERWEVEAWAKRTR